MENRTAGDFVLRQGLIPLRDLANSPLKPDGFDLAQLQAQIEAQGLKVDNFYYNPHESSSLLLLPGYGAFGLGRV